MTTQRLSALDTSFLHLEGPSTPMHISSLAIYEGGPAPVGDIRTGFERRLHLVPRFRQRVVDVPFGAHRPVWVDDPDFDLDRHLQHVAVPAPGDESQLLTLCGRLLSMPLDRTQPLWEMWVIDGLADGRFAILSKTHHAMWDGIAGADAHAVLLDAAVEPQDPEPEPWSPPAKPGPAGLLVDALRERLTEPLELGRDALRAMRSPLHTMGEASRLASGALSLARDGLRPAPACPLNREIGSRRRYAVVRASLEEFKAAGRPRNATVNDVALASVAGALRDWFSSRGRMPRELRTMVPVSVRRPDEQGQPGNRVTLVLVPLPVDEEDPNARLESIAARMRRLKTSGQVQAGELVTTMAAFAPPQAVAAVTRFQSQRLFNVLVTNIPGPQFPLYLRGCRLLELFPQAPLSADQGLAVALMSYDGKLGFGLLADDHTMPDLEVFASALDRSIRATLAAADRAPKGGRLRQRARVGAGTAG